MNEPLLKNVRVRCDPERAFEAFTKDIDMWWPRGHRRLDDATLFLEPKVGGRFFEKNEAGEEFLLGEILACDPPHRISFTWTLGAIFSPTRVDIRFEADGEETVVHVRHTEADSELGEAWPQRVALFTRGWDHVLAALSEHLDN